MHAGLVVKQPLEIVLVGGVDEHRPGRGHVAAVLEDRAIWVHRIAEDPVRPHLKEEAHVSADDGGRAADPAEDGGV